MIDVLIPIYRPELPTPDMAQGKQYRDQYYGDRPSFRVLWRDNHGNILLAMATLILIVGGLALLIPEEKPRVRTVRSPILITEPASEGTGEPSESNAFENAAEADEDATGGGQDSDNSASTDTAVLRIVVAGLDSDRGLVRLAIYQDQETFNKPEQAAERANLTIKAGRVEWDVSVPVGKPVAICAYHDKNEDGTLNKSLFGIPVEKYGFSLGTRSPRGPPPFVEAAFEPEPGVTEVPIQIW